MLRASWCGPLFSRARVGLTVGGLEPLGADVGVDLSGVHRGVPQKFLDYPQIRAAFEHGGCCGVAEPVWGHVPHCELRVAADGLVNYSADLPLVEPTPRTPTSSAGLPGGASSPRWESQCVRASSMIPP